jgi:hypothetical protein
MFGELVLILGAWVVLLSVVPWPADHEDRTGAAMLRDAMRGDESAAVLAEFRRSGVQPPERRVHGMPVGW